MGLLLAREYSRHGAKLVLLARDAATLERACAELRSAGAEVLGIPCDVTDSHQVPIAIQRALEVFGQIDLVVNDAGRIEVGPARAMSTEDYEAAMKTNFWGAYNVISAVLPHLRGACPDRLRSIMAIHYGFEMRRPRLFAAFVASTFDWSETPGVVVYGNNQQAAQEEATSPLEQRTAPRGTAEQEEDLESAEQAGSGREPMNRKQRIAAQAQSRRGKDKRNVRKRR